jgi:hypothetical protein
MKARTVAAALLPLMATLPLGCQAESDSDDALVGQSEQALSVLHYDLDVVGVPYLGNATLDGIDATTFVQLGAANAPSSDTKIMFMQGTSFQVLDSNGTDQRAEFLLPPTTSGKYEVYAVTVGNPISAASTQNCLTDGTTGALLCNENNRGTAITIDFKSSKGKPTFSDVAPKLLHVCSVLFTDSNYDCYNIFDDALQGYFWNYDAQAFRRAHLRFYPKE